MSSRSLDDLHPPSRLKIEEFLYRCAGANLSLLITCTYRSNAEQAALYAKGRTTKGPNVSNARPMGLIVTKARPGSSLHNCRRAADVAILTDDGKVDWAWMDSPACEPLWERLGKIAVECGLDWGGNWQKIVDKPHVEDDFCEECRERFGADHFNESGECKDHGEP